MGGFFLANISKESTFLWPSMMFHVVEQVSVHINELACVFHLYVGTDGYQLAVHPSRMNLL